MYGGILCVAERDPKGCVWFCAGIREVELWANSKHVLDSSQSPIERKG